MPPQATSVQDNITAYWHGHAVAYDQHPLSQAHMGPLKDAWLAVLRSALPPPPADVLDVGTGTGFLAVLMAERGYRVTGIDLAEGMLELARAKGVGLPAPPAFQLGDAVAPPFPPGSFDAITCRYLLWTLREPERALANWRRLLRPAGRLVAIDSTWFADGVRREGGPQDAPGRTDFLERYTDEVVAALPLAEAQSIDAMVALVAAAGFADARAMSLPEIERLERAHCADFESDIRLQFLITARKG